MNVGTEPPAPAISEQPNSTMSAVVARFADPAALAAAVCASLLAATDALGRTRDLSAPWALVGHDVNAALIVLASLACVAAALSRRGTSVTICWASVAAAAAAGWLVRSWQGPSNPVSTLSAPLIAIAVVAALYGGYRAVRVWHPATDLLRMGQLSVLTSTTLAVARLAGAPSELLPDLRWQEARWSIAIAGASAALVVAAATRLRDVRRALSFLLIAACSLWTVVADPASIGSGARRLTATAMTLLIIVGVMPAVAFQWIVATGSTGVELLRTTGAATWRRARLLDVSGTAHRALRRSARTVLPTGTAPGAPTPRRLGRADRPWAAVVVAVSVGAVVARLVWAYRAGGQPIGHGASVMARSWDVGTSNTPVVGMPTSYSDPQRGVQVYHPGPLFFDVMAPFVRLLGLRSGAMVGSTVLNLTWWLGAVWAAFRAGGRIAALGAWVGAGAVIMVLLKGVVWEPATVFPTLAAIIACILLCWATASGAWQSWPWAVFVFGVICQAYLAHAILTIVPVVWAGAALLLAARQWPDQRRPALRAFWVGLAVGLATWIQPIVEALSAQGGNIRGLWYAVTSDRPSVGARGLWEAPAWLLQVPPLWDRFDRFFAPDYRAYVEGMTIVGPVLLVVVLACWHLTRREASLQERRLRALTVLSVVTAGISLAAMPMAFTAFYQIAWLGVISAFVWCSVGVTAAWALCRRIPATQERALRPIGLAAASLAVIALTAAAPTNMVELKGPYGTIDRAVPELAASVMHAVPRSDEILLLGMDRSTEQTIADAITADLIVNGYDVRVEPYIGSYFGPRRAVDADWQGRLVAVFDGSGGSPLDGRMIGRYVPDGWSQENFDRTAEQVRRWAVDHGPIVIDGLVAPFVAPYVDGWDPDLDCDRLRAIESGEFPLEELPAGAFAKLYADAAITSPQLPEELRRAVDADVGSTPTEVWLLDWGGSENPVESSRLLRSGELCSP